MPKGAEVMLVGYSQGGTDAQNIAMQYNDFKVTQVVTFGSPVRQDLDVPAVHLQANGDHIPGTKNLGDFGGRALSTADVDLQGGRL
jgi:pimeloyl-ACP methyl ester carboxylesterase